ncbi:MAG TPA: flagellar biosynthetic protein FliO [Symbiobacteriaceae bacterium]|nr:flagellar biosynthetic protein FliO [Symbiobacteriaceae bacterium]
MNPSTGLLTFLLASLAVIGLTYFASRMLGNWHAIQTRSRRMRVLEGVPIGKDRHLLLVAVGKEVLVVGASQSGVNLVHRVEDQSAAAEFLASVPAGPQAAPLADMGAVEQGIRSNLERMRSLLNRSAGRNDA